MDFKKNWAKITMAAIAGILGLLFLISVFVKLGGEPSGLDLVKGTHGFSNFAFLYLVPALFFLGISAYMILKLLDMDYAKYVLVGVGALNLIFSLIWLIDMIDYITFSHSMMTLFLAPLVIYALFPLIKGIKKLMCACDQEEKAAPRAASTSAAKK